MMTQRLNFRAPDVTELPVKAALLSDEHMLLVLTDDTFICTVYGDDADEVDATLLCLEFDPDRLVQLGVLSVDEVSINAEYERFLKAMGSKECGRHLMGLSELTLEEYLKLKQKLKEVQA